MISGGVISKLFNEKLSAEMEKYVWWVEKARKIEIVKKIPEMEDYDEYLPNSPVRAARYEGKKLIVATPSKNLIEKYKYIAEYLGIPFEISHESDFKRFTDWLDEKLSDKKRVLVWGPISLYSRLKRKIRGKTRMCSMDKSKLGAHILDSEDATLIYLSFLPYGDLAGEIVAGVDADLVVAVSSAGTFGGYKDLILPGRIFYYSRDGLEDVVGSGDFKIVTVEHILLEDADFIEFATKAQAIAVDCESYHVVKSRKGKAVIVLYPRDNLLNGEQYFNRKEDPLKMQAIRYAEKVILNFVRGF